MTAHIHRRMRRRTPISEVIHKFCAHIHICSVETVDSGRLRDAEGTKKGAFRLLMLLVPKQRLERWTPTM